MSDMKAAIMDAAERRMQQGGFGGFSFREIAADVGIKSSSVTQLLCCERTAILLPALSIYR